MTNAYGTVFRVRAAKAVLGIRHSPDEIAAMLGVAYGTLRQYALSPAAAAYRPIPPDRYEKLLDLARREHEWIRPAFKDRKEMA